MSSRLRSGSVEQPLGNAAHAVWDGSVSTAAELKALLLPITPSDEEFRLAFAVQKVSNARLARYYLRSLESEAQTTPNPWYVLQTDPEQVNLEHIMPKKPDGNWPQLDDEIVGRYATRLGNLALMRKVDNSNLRSSAFEDKRGIYAKSPYVLTNQLGAVTAWDDSMINDRQTTLSKLAITTWKVT